MTVSSLTMRITPFVGVGELRFGSRREDVRAVVGSTPEVRRRSAWERSLTDRYDEWWLTVDYSDGDEVDFVEVGDGKCTVMLGEVQLMPGRADEVVGQLRAAGYDPREDEAGYAIGDAGVVLFVPSSESGARVESVSAKSRDLGELDIAFFGESDGPTVTAWPVEPGVGIAEVRFGETRDAVRARMGEGMSWSTGGGRTDQYWGEGLVVTFDGDDRVSEIVAVAPAEPAVAGVEVLGRTYDALRAAFAAVGVPVSVRPAELYLPDLDVSVWWTRTDNPEVPASAVAMRRS